MQILKKIYEMFILLLKTRLFKMLLNVAEQESFQKHLIIVFVKKP